MSTKKKVAALRAEIAPLMQEISLLEEDERRRANEKLVGKCYRYRNRYSQSESWWLYSVIVGLDEYGHIKAVRFQRASDGRVSVDYDHVHYSEATLGTPISRAEVRRAWAKISEEASRVVSEAFDVT